MKYDHTTIIRAPNKLNRGVEYYCAYDDDFADHEGAETWSYAMEGGPPAQPALDKRDACKKEHCVEMIGGPMQYILRKQVNDAQYCDGFADASSCPLDRDNLRNQNVHANVPEGAEWNDFGYDVLSMLSTRFSGTADSRYLPTGDCTARPGETVCMHADMWHTAVSINGCLN